MKSTCSIALCPSPSLTVMVVAVVGVLVRPDTSVTVNAPPAADGEVTVTAAVFELVAVNELTPASLALKVVEKYDDGQPDTP